MASNRQSLKTNQSSLNRKRPVRRGEVKPQRGSYPKKEHYHRRRQYMREPTNFGGSIVKQQAPTYTRRR
ncbi:unnamed protein product [Callosobruchus maculatus]|uniref:Uncharacterized protein n=1 Tax=Callosobruchus maculatus TaxID=64391 RepID=A0A653D360_CALMS|nr:unnamed protein product [Callosobruchus maculatus]